MARENRTMAGRRGESAKQAHDSVQHLITVAMGLECLESPYRQPLPRLILISR